MLLVKLRGEVRGELARPAGVFRMVRMPVLRRRCMLLLMLWWRGIRMIPPRLMLLPRQMVRMLAMTVARISVRIPYRIRTRRERLVPPRRHVGVEKVEHSLAPIELLPLVREEPVLLLL